MGSLGITMKRRRTLVEHGGKRGVNKRIIVMTLNRFMIVSTIKLMDLKEQLIILALKTDSKNYNSML